MGEVNEVSGIKSSAIKGEVIRAAAAAIGIDASEVASDEQLGVAMTLWFEKELDKRVQKAPSDAAKAAERAKLSACDACGGRSLTDIGPNGQCPYCGTKDDEEDPVAKKKKQRNAKADALALKAEAELQPKRPDLVPLTREQKLAKAEREKASAGKVQELDKAVIRVTQLKAQASADVWDIGVEVAKIYEGQLWKHRLNRQTGEAVYKTWEAFCREELGFTPQHALKLADVSKTFTREEVLQFGTSKLGLVLQAPEEQQEKLKDQVAQGASKKDIERQVREAKASTGHVKPARVGSEAQAQQRKQLAERAQKTGNKEAAKKNQKGAPVEKISIAQILGKQTVKLYAKPARTANLSDEQVAELKRAKKIGDAPWGRLVLPNGVVCEYTVQQSGAGELILAINVRRLEE